MKELLLVPGVLVPARSGEELGVGAHGLHRARPSHYDPVPRDVQQTLVSSRLADAE